MAAFAIYPDFAALQAMFSIFLTCTTCAGDYKNHFQAMRFAVDSL